MTTATAWMVTYLGPPTDALEIQTVEVGEPGVNQMRIAVEAFCLDFNDIDTIRGRYGLLKFEPPSSSAWPPRAQSRPSGRDVRPCSAGVWSVRPRACKVGTRRWPCSTAPRPSRSPRG